MVMISYEGKRYSALEDSKTKSIIESVNPEDDPLKMIKEFLALNISGMNSNPILREWYNRDLDSHKKEIGIKYFPRILDYLAEFVIKGLTDYQK